MLEKLVIFGAGGHAKVVIDAIEQEGLYQIAFLADADSTLVGSSVRGYPVRLEEDGFAAPASGIRYAFIAIGSNAVRRCVADAARRGGLTLVTVIHPQAVVAGSAVIGSGTLVMPGSVINADAQIGDNVIVNTGAVIEHDCMVDEDAHIAPHATLCGGAHIGVGSLVGAGATVLVGVRVGAGVVVGAGSTVLADIPAGAHAVGSPCRILERKV